ncbi:cytochrome P450 [Acanthopleuribacter pedis]|uniref:Cytochrome P450 n=1 Tax=Acanthopleuribacter pedis TaxID=442870 RepID=A0A8J7QA71_9BACT|nr:cytochrome P450 [Acanthopleuribacter pedis]MBO1320667.1 cytochrome P450 [Acanthopleuribacter pedis]
MSVKIKVAEEDVTREALFRGRYQVYVEEMAAMPTNPDGLIIDRFDTFSATVNIACIAENEVVGGIRMTEKLAPLGTPADHLFDFSPYVPPEAPCAGSSMLFMRKEYRGRSELIMGLFLMGYFWAVKRGAEYLLAPVNPPVGAKLRRIGFTQVAEDCKAHGLPIRPMVWDFRQVNSIFLRFLEMQQLNTFALNFHREFFAPGEYIMRQGDTADAAYVIVDGQAEVSVGEPDGEIAPRGIGTVGPGDLVGEVALLVEGDRTANIRAVTAVDTVVLDRERFKREIVKNPEQSMRLLQLLGTRLQNVTELLTVGRMSTMELRDGTQGGTRPVKHFYDPSNPDIRRNPYPIYEHIRTREPVHYNPILQAWMVFGYEQAQAMLKNSNASSRRAELLAKKVPAAVRDKAKTFTQTANDMLLFLDPPEHRRKRHLTARPFSMRMVRRLEPTIRDMVDKALKRIADQGRFDMVHDLALPLPLGVIGAMLGVPESDRHTLKTFSEAMSLMVNHPKPSAEMVVQGSEGMEALFAYFRDLIAERRRQPQSDLISEWIKVEEQGDLLSAQEVLVNGCLLLFAGHETTTNLLGTGLYNLLRHGEQLQRLREEPNLIESAVEEMLRFESPVQMVTRIARADFVASGKQINRGDPIFVVLGSANRDRRHFNDPERFDITRRDSRHLAFGYGEHFCLGSGLARLEAKIVFEQLLEFFPSLSLAADQMEWKPDIMNRGLLSLPIAFETH